MVKPKIKKERLKMRKTYDKEFKLNAIMLCKESGKKSRDVEKDLGIGAGCISHWKKELEAKGELVFPGKGKLNEHDAEMAKIKKENEILRQERDILKKALGIFSQHSR